MLQPTLYYSALDRKALAFFKYFFGIADCYIDEKKRIAQQALQEIHEGDSIILDSSTTIVELARLLAESSLNITVMNCVRKD